MHGNTKIKLMNKWMLGHLWCYIGSINTGNSDWTNTILCYPRLLTEIVYQYGLQNSMPRSGTRNQIFACKPEEATTGGLWIRILWTEPTWWTDFLSKLIAFLYVLRATMCPSSEENTVPMRHLVLVIYIEWLIPGVAWVRYFLLMMGTYLPETCNGKQ